jgi:hypothetical protein
MKLTGRSRWIGLPVTATISEETRMARSFGSSPTPFQPPTWALCLAAAFLAGCAENVVLRRAPGVDPGALRALQRCDPGEVPCAPDPNPDTSRFNLSHTTYLSLPDCPYGIERIAVLNVGSSSAFADVQCAAPPQASPPAGGGLPTTTVGGGTR